MDKQQNAIFSKFQTAKKNPKVPLISFEDLLKISNFAKLQHRSSKNEPAMPISILNFPRAWQPHFLSHTLQILVKHAFFIDVQMLLVSYFCSSYQKVRI